MYLIKCPDDLMIKAEQYLYSEDEMKCKFGDDYFSEIIFLAGGITSYPIWQPIVIEGLKNTKCVLIDPRRDNWDVNDKTLEEEQIKWEHFHLDNSMSIVFWFPKETLCPITLFELGKYLKSDKRLYIGCHPEYAKRNDVKIQVGLEKSNQIIHESLDDLISEVILDLIEKKE